MKTNDPVETALKRRPSDERDYDEPLRALTETATEHVRPAARLRAGERIRGGSGMNSRLMGLAAAGVAIVLLVGALASLALRNAGPVASGPIDTGPVSGFRVACWGLEPGFDSGLLTGAGTAEQGTTPAAAVLRAFLVSTDGNVYSSQGWHVVSQTPDVVRFMAPANDMGGPEYQGVIVRRDESGQYATDGWSAASYGFCSMRTIPPAGYGSATWTLDPAYAFTAADTELHILVDESACHGTESTPVDRIQADVTYGGTSIVVTVSARLPEDAQECPKPPPAAYTVQLQEPLGKRGLVDGGPWPAVTVVPGQPSATPTPTASLAGEPTSSPSAGQTFIVYTIKVGDTMQAIAAKFGVSYAQLVAANPQIANPDHILVGQAIYVPWQSWQPPAS